ncbi:hypothetical protein RNJ44_00278 [Nakaseomyces bracarensis]|uniref:Protein-lysine N-methyltransferase n=1 Tax=Nakaseomyces bracarensis TaxID=273131 RepID=A0ABR4NTE3_9SACH
MLTRLLDWARENGAELREGLLEYGYDDVHGYHVKVRDIDGLFEHKDVIRVPKKLFITKELAQSYFKVEDPEKKFNDNPNALTQFFLSYVTYSQGNEYQGFFQPYTDILPSIGSLATHPFFWDTRALQHIKGSDLFLTIKEKLVGLCDEFVQYSKLYGFAGDEHLPTIDSRENDDQFYKLVDYIQTQKSNVNGLKWDSFVAYLWSSIIFLSRAFPSIVTGEDKKELNLAFLLPIVDLLNHNNDSKVKWSYSDDEFIFHSQDLVYLKNGDELFNNYGDKTNMDFLLSYGFINERENLHNSVNLTLKLNADFLQSAKEFIPNLNVVNTDSVTFKITKKDPLPQNLVKFFGYITKLRSEDQITVRAMLEGTDQLDDILRKKQEFTKMKTKTSGLDPEISKIIKQYFNEEKKLFQYSLETVAKNQKGLLTAAKDNIVSFKTIFKSDKVFANSLLLAYGVTKFDDLIAKDCVNEAILLWIVRAANKESYGKTMNSVNIPQFIIDTFHYIAGSIVVEKEDVSSFLPLYKKLFPNLATKIPEVYKVGDWGIKQFIIADTLVDRLVWIRKTSNEPLFIQKTACELK